MSCPDWRVLAGRRDEAVDREAADWSAAVAHFESGCTLCRRDALAADPILVFRRLRTAAEMSQAQEASEVDAVRQAVAAMRTASRVDSIESRNRAGWKRWVAAAGLIAAALSVTTDNAWQRQGLPGQAAAGRRGAVLPASYAGATGTGATELPTAEGGRPGARVYHMDGEGMSVVMIVDESLNV
jgi:transcriptional regulator with XRE-family HTH domain